MTYKHVTYDTPACRAARQLCIERLGKCQDCPHAVPSLGNTCKISGMAEVRQAIARQQAKPVSRRSARAKLTPADVWVILDLLDTGMQLKEIGAAMGVSATTVGDIRDGIRWREVHREWHAKRRKAG